ncbi:hypothetical protein BCR39DRAFT_530963 [Naematelia encephala]|uniref:Uncharacterized protein n=1 Tax=Naematelia encephala TaxID=71784 RepID=A0A1Y2B5E6_9TREE|nr:hypothetical protein BCR39DRAFT_530963 [Naematelia encephala]
MDAHQSVTPARFLMHRGRVRSPSPSDMIGKRLRQTFTPRRDSSVSPEWSTLPCKKNRWGTSLSNPSKKASDKFRKPVNILGRRALPRETSPNRVSKPQSQPHRPTKVTLFTPSSMDQVDHLPTPSQIYEIQTIKGSKFGATLTEQGQQSGRFGNVYEQLQSRDQSKMKRPRFTRDPGPSSSTALVVDEVEDDWTKAWRKPKSDINKRPITPAHYRGYERYEEQRFDHQEEYAAAHSGHKDPHTNYTYHDDQQGVKPNSQAMTNY